MTGWWKTPALLAALAFVLLPRYGGSQMPGFGTVANNAALQNLSAGQYVAVTRAGFAAPGDAPPVSYTWSPANCPLPDNGAQVAPNSGTGCWLGTMGAVIDPREWGEAANSEAHAPIQAAINYAVRSGRPLVLSDPVTLSSGLYAPPGLRMQSAWGACLTVLAPGGFAAVATVDAIGHTVTQAASQAGVTRFDNLCVHLAGNPGTGLMTDGMRNVQVYGGLIDGAAPLTYISAQLTGTTGGIGTYTVYPAQTVTSETMTGLYPAASFSGSIAGTTLTVTAVASGSLPNGTVLTGAGLIGTWACPDDFGPSTCPNAEMSLKANKHDNTEETTVIGTALLGQGYTPSLSGGCNGGNYSGIGLWLGVGSANTGYANVPNYNTFTGLTTYCNVIGVRDDVGNDNQFFGGDFDFAGAYAIVVGIDGGTRSVQGATFIKPGLEVDLACGILLTSTASATTIEDIDSTASTPAAVCRTPTAGIAGAQLASEKFLAIQGKSASFNVPCDGGRFYVSTNLAAVSATMCPLPITGAAAEFFDSTGHWSVNAFTVNGNGFNVNGLASKPDSTNWDHFCLWFGGNGWYTGACPK